MKLDQEDLWNVLLMLGLAALVYLVGGLALLAFRAWH